MSMKPKIYMPTEEEDREINRGIEADPDTYVPNDEAFSKMSRRGRPKSETPKVQLTIRYDKAVIDAFKAGGPGWQTRMNEALKKAVTRKHT
ncbi:MAG: BrnA antitoxin family protein [Castellaniella sp.]|uniref:BrnA antitoxin family protein n=1 Tax=Castellaniella sp. TaxID=1955812 RepID=UPI003C711F6B